MQHLKCNYDPAWDYPAIARTLFGHGKCLVVAEKISTNAHVHFQGITDLSHRQFEKAITELAATHWEKVLKPSGRPVKRARRDIDEKGFQYLCKEDRPPLYSQGFTEEELQALRDASDAHVDELKHGLGDHLATFDYPADPQQALTKMRLDALEYYDGQDKRPGPRFQKDVLWIMYKHKQSSPAWKLFVSERI